MSLRAQTGPSLHRAFPTAAFRSFDHTNAPALPLPSITSFAQDTTGLLWIGSLDGLASYDGATVRAEKSPPGAPGFGAVNALVAPSSGGLVVGSYNGLHVFDGRRWSYVPDLDAVTALAESHGEVWWANARGILRRIRLADGRTAQPTTVDGISHVRELRPGPGGEVLIRGRDGLWVSQGPRAVNVSIPVPASDLSTAAADHLGRVWAGTTRGALWCRAPNAAAWRLVRPDGDSDGPIRGLVTRRTGQLVAATTRSGLLVSDDGGDWYSIDQTHGLRSNLPRTLFADREGGVWVGFGSQMGIQVLASDAIRTRNQWRGETRPLGPLAVFGVSQTDSGSILAAVYGRGVILHREGLVRELAIPVDVVTPVRHVVEHAPGRLWAGVGGEIWDGGVDRSWQRAVRLDDSGYVGGFFRSPAGAWYATTSAAGLFVHEGGRWRPVDRLNARLPSLNVRGLTWRANGDLWVVTTSGVLIASTDGSVSTMVVTEGGLPALLNCALEVSPEEMWLAGLGGIGVLRDRRWRLMTAADGLPGESVYSLVRGPSGEIWAGGSRGIGRYEGGRWATFGSSAGMTSQICNLNGLQVDQQGVVFVGTLDGLVRFDPRLLNRAAASLTLRWLSAPGSIEAGHAVLLPDARAEFAWTAAWLGADPVEYRTRITDGGWSSPTTRGDLVVAGLPPGDATIDVQARRSGDEAWSAPLQYRLYREPRWWETTTVRVAGAMAGAALLGLSLGWLLTRSRRRQRELQSAVDEALARVKVLSGLVPVCAWCHKVRDDRGYWRQIERYVSEHSDAEFSHGICPDCEARLAREADGIESPSRQSHEPIR